MAPPSNGTREKKNETVFRRTAPCTFPSPACRHAGGNRRRPLLIGFALLGTLFTVPLLTAIRNASGPWEAFALIACAWIIVSGYTSINALVKAELFPASIRATGVGVPYAFAVSVFGGTAEYLALWFKSVNLESGFYWYTTGVIACTLVVCFFMRDTRAQSKIDADTQA